MDYQVGQKYDVPCAEILWKEDNRIYYVPVFDHLHVDPQFGFEHLHYHIDGRFELHPRMKHRLNVTDGHTLSVIVTHDEAIYKFQRLVPQQLKCERRETGLLFASTVDERRLENLKRYEEWYAGFVGKSCEGKRCPHYGTEMLERDGKLVCPMHGLTADRATLRIIQSPRV